jgi:hypothetical protein
VNLYSPWQVQFWGGSGVTTVAGGSLLGGLGGIPVKATGTAGDITIVNQPVDGTLAITGESGLTAEESTALTFIKDVVEGDQSISATVHIVKRKGTAVVLVQKNVTESNIPDGTTIELLEP